MSDLDTRANERAAASDPDAAGRSLLAKTRSWIWAEIPCESCEGDRRGVKEAIYDTELSPSGAALPSPSEPPKVFTKEDCVACDGTGVEVADDNYRLRYLAHYGDVGARRLTEHFSWPLPPEDQCAKHGVACDGACGYTRRPLQHRYRFCGLSEHLQLVGAYGAAWLALGSEEARCRVMPIPVGQAGYQAWLRTSNGLKRAREALDTLALYLRRPTPENKKTWLLAALSTPTWVPGAVCLSTMGPPIFDHLASVRSAIEASGKTEEEVYRVVQAKVEEWCFKGQEIT